MFYYFFKDYIYCLFLGTFCGVFRRQALDRGAVMLNVDHIVTGHNADDIAETVLMNSMFYFTFVWVRGSLYR
jgi:tRNA(Ile)-lysidine synthase TilS/MesJ